MQNAILRNGLILTLAGVTLMSISSTYNGIKDKEDSIFEAKVDSITNAVANNSKQLYVELDDGKYAKIPKKNSYMDDLVANTAHTYELSGKSLLVSRSLRQVYLDSLISNSEKVQLIENELANYKN